MRPIARCAIRQREVVDRLIPPRRWELALRRRLGTDEQRQHALETLLHRRRSLRARSAARSTAAAGTRLAG